MYHQNSCLFYNRISYDRDYSGLSTDDEEGMRIAKQLGDKSVLFMCNHGILVVAPNAARAFDDVYYLERASMTQVRHLWSSIQGGLPKVLVIKIMYAIIYETDLGWGWTSKTLKSIRKVRNPTPGLKIRYGFVAKFTISTSSESKFTYCLTSP